MTTRDEVKERREAWERQYPNYCRCCGGHGAFYSTYDPSPAGVSLGPGYMTDSDPCTDCVELGHCPRCGAMALDEEGGHCAECGWDYIVSEEEDAPPMTVKEWDQMEAEARYEAEMDEMERQWRQKGSEWLPLPDNDDNPPW